MDKNFFIEPKIFKSLEKVVEGVLEDKSDYYKSVRRRTWIDGKRITFLGLRDFIMGDRFLINYYKYGLNEKEYISLDDYLQFNSKEELVNGIYSLIQGVFDGESIFEVDIDKIGNHVPLFSIAYPLENICFL